MSDNKERTLFCGNLSEKVTEDILYELFLQAGPLESVTIPKDKDGKPRRFAFITFKHAVSVPYTLALMNGLTLYGKSVNLDARTGAESEHNPYLEKLMHYRNSIAHQNVPSNRNYNANRRESYEDNSWRYGSRRFESRPEPQRAADPNQWNPYPQQPYNVGTPLVYPSNPQNQERFSQNSIPQVAYPYGGRNWGRNHR